jgi:hypothetical protein
MANNKNNKLNNVINQLFPGQAKLNNVINQLFPGQAKWSNKLPGPASAPAPPNYSAGAHARPKVAAPAPSGGSSTSSTSASGSGRSQDAIQGYTAGAQQSVNPSGPNYVNPNAGAGGGGTSYAPYVDPNASANAEKAREFDITTQRDIAKENALEVDNLQKELAGLTGPKDTYADYFFSHGLLPPRGYKPAPVPLTDAQIAAFQAQGVSPAQLQSLISGNGQATADQGMLGNLGNSLQAPAGQPQPLQASAPPAAQGPSNPGAVAGSAGYGANGVVPAQNALNTPPPATPNMPPANPMAPQPVPSMAGGGQVPGPTGTPSLAVVHGGEQVTPAPGGPAPSLDNAPQMPPGGPQGQSQGAGQSLMSAPGLHPAIAALVDAVSGLLQNPDFAPFVAGTLKSSQATPGGTQSMAVGGTVPGAPTTAPPGAVDTANPSATQMETYQETGRYAAPSPAASPMANTGANQSLGGLAGMRPSAQSSALGAPSPQPIGGAPQAGAQGVQSNTGAAGPVDNPVMPVANMDPYTRALYDTHGRLHPYSAQQEAQMGPAGTAAVGSYIGKVLGGDINAYTDLVTRLKPIGAAPASNSGTGEGFSFG